jgi:hypothetical protein
MASEDHPPELSSELTGALVDVFSHFRDLTREEKRQLLREFRIRIRVKKIPGPGRRKVLQVSSIRLGLFHDNAVIYKKMKRRVIVIVVPPASAAQRRRRHSRGQRSASPRARC